MTLYSYSARNAQGERVHGSIDASDITAARLALAEKALIPEEVFQISYDTKAPVAAPANSAAPAPKAVPQPVPAAPPAPAPVHKPLVAPKVVSIPPPSVQAPAHDWQAKSAPKKEESVPETDARYYPFLDTMRLYAGWLLAWYAVVYALGLYQTTRSLPFQIPYLMGIYASPLVLSFALAAFLFLLMTSIYKTVGRGSIAALLCTVGGVLAFVLYRVNV
jgi:hypothetical protein